MSCSWSGTPLALSPRNGTWLYCVPTQTTTVQGPDGLDRVEYRNDQGLETPRCGCGAVDVPVEMVAGRPVMGTHEAP
jgi:hypothetical protein